jgi:hypothetical protein
MCCNENNEQILVAAPQRWIEDVSYTAYMVGLGSNHEHDRVFTSEKQALRYARTLVKKYHTNAYTKTYEYE